MTPLSSSASSAAPESTWLFRQLYPAQGPLRRALYPKHCAFFHAGATCRERWVMAANRVGKTLGIGAYETTCHLTGLYPDWWTGKRFAHPVSVWIAGETSEKTRDAIQAKLLGRLVPERGQAADASYAFGHAMVPAHLIVHYARSTKVKDAIETVWVRHVTGGLSRGQFKAYSQGPIAFASEEIDLIWFDEEPPMDIYTEALLRTMTTEGIVLVTATPLQGFTELVVSYLGEAGTLPAGTS